MRPFPLAKIARFTLVGYAAALTIAVVLALTVGPFKEPLMLQTKIRVLESDLRENEKVRKSLEEERGRLLTAVKSVQADWASQRETIRTLRKMGEDSQSNIRLEEANQQVEKLTQERAVLITKLNELMQTRAVETEPKRPKEK